MNAEEIHDQDREHQLWTDQDQEREKLKKIIEDEALQEDAINKTTEDAVLREDDVINKIIINQDNTLNQHPMKLVIEKVM